MSIVSGACKARAALESASCGKKCRTRSKTVIEGSGWPSLYEQKPSSRSDGASMGCELSWLADIEKTGEGPVTGAFLEEAALSVRSNKVSILWIRQRYSI